MSDEACSKERESRPYLTFKFMGLEIKFGGKEILSLAIAMLVGGPVVAGIYLHHEETSKNYNEIKTYMLEQIEVQDATNYILTLSAEERELLKLTKPRRIKKMELDAIYEARDQERNRNGSSGRRTN